MKIKLDKQTSNGIKAIYECRVLKIISDLVRDGNLLPGGIRVKVLKPTRITDGFDMFLNEGDEILIGTSFVQENKTFIEGEKYSLAYIVQERSALSGTYLVQTTPEVMIGR